MWSKFNTLSALILVIQNELMHFFLQQTGLTAQWQHHMLRDSWPLQGRCKEKSWDLVTVSRPGWYPVDNMLPMPDLSGSCQSICFPISMKATWRTHRLLHICRPFFYVVAWWLNVSQGLFGLTIVVLFNHKLSVSNTLIQSWLLISLSVLVWLSGALTAP